MKGTCHMCREYGTDRVEFGSGPRLILCYPCWADVLEEAWGLSGEPLWAKLRERAVIQEEPVPGSTEDYRQETLGL